MPRSQQSVSCRLPAPSTALFGRDDDVAYLCQLLHQPGRRLVTLTGVGGSGKTRLALVVAAALEGSFKDGIWYVGLAALADPGLVPHAVASLLGVRERTDRSALEALLAHVAPRQLLLVLDNCEHLVQSCAELVDALLQGAPDVHVLATSREPLRIPGDLVWRVPPLTFPDPHTSASTDDPGAYPAVQLFADRAAAVSPGFVLTPRNAPLVAAVCARLEGLPLAIELAAAWARALGVDEILQRLDNAMGLLVGGSRTAPTRQRTMAATLDWSYGLLTPAEKLVFQRLAVFVGGWTLDAAESVCVGGGVATTEVLGSLTRLVDASLVQVEEPNDRPRYRLLEPVRQYARGRLVEARRLAGVRRRHAEFFLRYAEHWEKDANGGGPNRAIAQSALERERDNLRSALRWCVEQGEAEMGLRLSRAHWSFWCVRGAFTEGRAWSAELTQLPDAGKLPIMRALVRCIAATLALRQGGFEETRAIDTDVLPLARQANEPPWFLPSVLVDLAFAAVNLGDYRDAEAHFDEALAVAREAGDHVNEAIALRGLGWVALWQEQYPRAQVLCEESLVVARAAGDAWTEAVALGTLGWTLLREGDHTAARTLVEDSLELRRRLSDRFGYAYGLHILGQIAAAQGRGAEASAALRESLQIRNNIGDGPGIADTLESIGALTWTARPDDAVQFAGAAAGVRESAGVAQSPMARTLLEDWLIPLRKALGSDKAALLFEAGRTCAHDQIDTALKVTPAPRRQLSRQSDHSVLSPREREVAALLARRLSNRQIADQLVVTERTVAAHVEHILAKLGFASRHQVGAWAAERGLPG
jgi:predicted ATPase/DNA-binding CsgD family transcriptional regulator